MKKTTFGYKQTVTAEMLNERFADLAGGSILNGFRLAKGTGNYSISLRRMNDKPSAAITEDGVRVMETADVIDAVVLRPNTNVLERFDVVYVAWQHDAGAEITFDYTVVEGVPGLPVNIETKPTNRLPLGYVRLRTNVAPTVDDLTSLDIGVKFGTLYANGMIVNGTPILTKGYVDEKIGTTNTRVEASESELALSRKNYSTLNDRIENELKQKRDLLTPIVGADLAVASDADKIKVVHLSDEVLQRMAGTTPVNATPAVNSITTEKLADGSVTQAKVSPAVFDALKADVNTTALLTRLNSEVENRITGIDSISALEDVMRNGLITTGSYDQTSALSVTGLSKFRLVGGDAKSYFFITIPAVGELAPGKTLSAAFRILNGDTLLTKRIRFSANNNQIGSLIPLPSIADGWNVVENVTIPATTDQIQLRLDYRDASALGKNVEFSNVSIFSGKTARNSLSFLFESVRRQDANNALLERDTRVNLFPDPLLKGHEWCNYRTTDSNFIHSYANGSNRYLILTSNNSGMTHAIGREMNVAMGSELSGGETIEIDFTITSLSVEKVNDVREFQISSFDTSGLETKIEKITLVSGKNTLRYSVPVDAVKIRLSWKLAGVATTYRVDTVNVSKPRPIGKTQTMPLSGYVLKEYADNQIGKSVDSLKMNLFPNPNMTNASWVNYLSTSAMKKVPHEIILDSSGKGVFKLIGRSEVAAVGYDLQKPVEMIVGDTLELRFRVTSVVKGNAVAKTDLSIKLLYYDALENELSRYTYSMSTPETASLSGPMPAGTKYIRVRFDVGASATASDSYQVTDVSLIQSNRTGRLIDPSGEFDAVRRERQVSMNKLSVKNLTSSGANLIYGWKGDLANASIVSHAGDAYYYLLAPGNTTVDNNRFTVGQDASQGFWFYSLYCKDKLAPGNKISGLLRAVSGDARVELRFLNGSTPIATNAINSPYIAFKDIGEGWRVIEEVVVPVDATIVEFRVDNRTTGMGVPFIFEYPSIYGSAFVTKPDILNGSADQLIKSIGTMSRTNYFPDPMIKTKDWLNFTPTPNVGSFEFVDGKSVFVAKSVSKTQKTAAGYRLSVPETLRSNDVLRMEVVVASVAKRPETVFQIVLLAYSGTTELTRSTKTVPGVGSFYTDLIIPSGTDSILMRFDVDDISNGGATDSTMKFERIYLCNQSMLTSPESLLPDLYTVKNLISSMQNSGKTLFVSPNGSDLDNGKETMPLKSIQKAIDLGATVIVAERGDYFISSTINANNKDQLAIIAKPHPAYDSATQPNVKKVRVIGADKLQDWIPYDGLFKQSYANNTYFKNVFVDKSLPAVTSSSRPSFNATIYEGTLKLEPVLTLAECTQRRGTFFYDGIDVYMNPLEGTITGKEFYAPKIGAGMNLTKIRNLILQDVNMSYCTTTPMNLAYSNAFLQNCEANMGLQSDGFSLDYVNGMLMNCSASFNRNDGFNLHSYGDTILYNCDGFNNYDDGISHHDGCTGMIYGGRWYNNGKGGIIPTYGSRVHVHGAECFNNVFGIYYGATEGQHLRRTVQIADVLTYGNQTGIYIGAEYDALVRNAISRNNNIGVQTVANGSIVLEGSKIVDNAESNFYSSSRRECTLNDNTLSDSKRGIVQDGKGTLKLSRNHVLHHTTSGLYETAAGGKITVVKRNNLFGNTADYEGSMAQVERDKNVSFPML